MYTSYCQVEEKCSFLINISTLTPIFWEWQQFLPINLKFGSDRWMINELWLLLLFSVIYFGLISNLSKDSFLLQIIVQLVKLVTLYGLYEKENFESCLHESRQPGSYLSVVLWLHTLHFQLDGYYGKQLLQEVSRHLGI